MGEGRESGDDKSFLSHCIMYKEHTLGYCIIYGQASWFLDFNVPSTALGHPRTRYRQPAPIECKFIIEGKAVGDTARVSLFLPVHFATQIKPSDEHLQEDA